MSAFHPQGEQSSSYSTVMRKWDSRFLSLCSHIAEWSEDPSRKVGAVVVGDGHCVISTGYNGLPRGISDLHPDRFDQTSGTKYFWMEHAERNAIYNAARGGATLLNSTIYTNLFPCADCARAIIQSGIKALVTFSAPKNEERFAHSMQASLAMLHEAGVEVRDYQSPI